MYLISIFLMKSHQKYSTLFFSFDPYGWLSTVMEIDSLGNPKKGTSTFFHLIWLSLV